MITTTGTTNGYFQGVLDEPRVWNRALTQTEIITNINNRSPAVRDWCPLGSNEGTGTAVADSIATAANGTITGQFCLGTWRSIRPEPHPRITSLVSPADTATNVPDPHSYRPCERRAQ